MKAEITEKGVFNAAGNEVGVGEVIDITGDTLPAALVGKARIIKAKLKQAKTMIVNPAEGAVNEDAPQMPGGPAPKSK